MLELKHNGQVVTTLYVGAFYALDTYVYNEPVIPHSWLVYHNSVRIASGYSSRVEFSAQSLGNYQIEVTAVAPDGRGSTTVVTLPCIARRANPAVIHAIWSKSAYSPVETVTAKLHFSDPEGLPPKSLQWTLCKNNQQVAFGSAPDVKFERADQGAYTLSVNGEDQCGNLVTAQFTISVALGFEIGACTCLVPTDGTYVLLGAVNSELAHVPAGTVIVAPKLLSSSSQSLYLVPGTTHVKFSFSSESDSLPDVAVARTATGNWYVKLNSETVPSVLSSYQVKESSVVPAPSDLKLDFTLDTYALHVEHSEIRYRVKVECYRLGPSVYRYSPCAYSIKLGGDGTTGRRWAVIPEELTIERNGETFVYKAPATTGIHYANLEPDGSPDPVNPDTRYTETEKNRAVVYECEGNRDIIGNAVSALEGVRPFVLSIVKHGLPVEINRIKSVRNIRVLVSGGGVNAGSIITVTVRRVNGQSNAYTFTVATTVYSSSVSDYVLAGVITTSISDYEFDVTGFTVDIAVNETGALSDSAGTETLAIQVDQPAYSSLLSNAIRAEGACFYGPALQTEFSAGSVYSGTAISSCADSLCGPVGVYCYKSQQAPYSEVSVNQPLHFPAPYVASTSYPSRCYSHPSLLHEGSDASVMLAYTENTLCGDPYLYRDCLTATELVTVYPVATVPHNYLAYGGRVYDLDSSFYGTAYGTLPVVTAAQVLPAVSCLDSEFTGSNSAGLSYLYFDSLTDEPVPVSFAVAPTLGNYGVADRVQVENSAQEPGSKVVTFAGINKAHFLTVTSDCTLVIETNATGIKRSIQVKRDGAVSEHFIAAGTKRCRIAVKAGDALSLSLGKFSERRFARIAVTVSWKPQRDALWKFDSVDMRSTQPISIQALGFCGANSWAGYTYVNNLPSDRFASTELPENMLVTVQSGSADYVLLQSKAINGWSAPWLTNMAWYAGQVLSGSLTFNFYSAADTGLHGEMDVWLSGTQAAFPNFLDLNGNRSLVKDARSYRIAATANHVSRASASAKSVTNAIEQTLYSDGSTLNLIAKTNVNDLFVGGTALSRVRQDLGEAVSASEDFSYVAAWISDFGIDNGVPANAATELAIANLVKSWSPTLIVSGGDVWQSEGSNVFATLDRYLGKYYADYIYPYPSSSSYTRSPSAPKIMRFHTAFGNHDTQAVARATLLKAYLGLDTETYAVLHWPVHWFFVDDTDNNPEGALESGETAQWLKKALADSTAPWKVVVMHQAPYSSGGGHSAYTTRRWPFKAWGAHAVFSGHDHIYERFNVDGLLTIVCGTCNNDVDRWDASPAPYSVFGYGLTKQLGACRITASKSQFKVEYIKQVDGLALDSVTLEK